MTTARSRQTVDVQGGCAMHGHRDIWRRLQWSTPSKCLWMTHTQVSDRHPFVQS